MFEYFGNITKVRTEIERYRNRLERAYQAILGESFEKVRDSSSRLLVNCDEPSKVGGALINFNNSYFGVGFEFDRELHISQKGVIGQNHARLFPYMHISQESIKRAAAHKQNNGLPKHLVPYLHEYNHFVLFCLQNSPDFLAGIIAVVEANRGSPTNRTNSSRSSNPKQLKWARIYACHKVVAEATQDFLMSLVYHQLCLDPRHAIRPCFLESLASFGIVDAKSLLDFNKSWNYRVPAFDKFQSNFLRSLENITVAKEQMPNSGKGDNNFSFNRQQNGGQQ